MQRVHSGSRSGRDSQPWKTRGFPSASGEDTAQGKSFRSSNATHTETVPVYSRRSLGLTISKRSPRKNWQIGVTLFLYGSYFTRAGLIPDHDALIQLISSDPGPIHIWLPWACIAH